jgi:hypothetical protein
MATRVLLLCGILSSLLYTAINIIVPLQWPAYNPAALTISELSAIGAPTRPLWLALSAPYNPLVLAFAIGVLRAARNSKGPRLAGLAVLAFGALGFLWAFAPMHSREVLAAGGGGFSDTFHVALGIVSATLMFTAIITASRSFGKGFFTYSMATLAVLVGFGILMGIDSPNIAVNGPTPLLGVWERIELGAFNLWVIVFALMLWNQEASSISPNTVRHSNA